MNVIDTLATAFAALSPRQRQNLAFHERRKTPICCGKWYSAYWRKGAG